MAGWRVRVTVNRHYFGLFLALFGVEALIALFVRDRWIRPYGGDFLVVILLYCLVKSFIRIKPVVAGFAVLLFSFLVEVLQSCDIARFLGFGGSPVMMTVIGSFFSWEDLIAYTAGISVAVVVDMMTAHLCPPPLSH